MGIQLHRCDNLQLVQNCLSRIFWLKFFVCFVSGKKVVISVHAWEKIMYATREEHNDSHSCFCALASLVHNFTLVRIIFFLPCSINIYYLLAGYKVHFIAPCGANKFIFWLPQIEKLSCATWDKHLFYSCWLIEQISHSKKTLFSPYLHNILFSTSGSWSEFYFPLRGKKFYFLNPSRKTIKIMNFLKIIHKLIKSQYLGIRGIPKSVSKLIRKTFCISFNANRLKNSDYKLTFEKFRNLFQN